MSAFYNSLDFTVSVEVETCVRDPSSFSYMAVEKPEGTIVLISFIGGSSYFQVSEQGPSFWREMLSENHNALRKDLAQGLEGPQSLA